MVSSGRQSDCVRTAKHSIAFQAEKRRTQSRFALKKLLFLDRQTGQWPESHGMIRASRREVFSVRREGHRPDSSSVATEVGDLFPCRKIPETDLAINAGDGHSLSIGGECDRQDLVFTAVDCGFNLAPGDVPKCDHRELVARREDCAVGREGQARGGRAAPDGRWSVADARQVARSQSMTAPSIPALANLLPFGAKATLATPPA